MTRIRTAILISGEGSNMQALIKAAKAPEYPAEIALVISNRPAAKGLELARGANIPAIAIDHKQFASRDAFDDALNQALKDAEIDLICMAGFMRLLGKAFINEWHNRQINIHPSLLPAFKGLNTHQRAIEQGVKIAGCTVHYVRHDMDAGPIIAQAPVPVKPDDTSQTLKTRVQKAEHILYPKALKAIAEGSIKISGDNLSFSDTFKEQSALFSPTITDNETH